MMKNKTFILRIKSHIKLHQNSKHLNLLKFSNSNVIITQVIYKNIKDLKHQIQFLFILYQNDFIQVFY